MRGQRLHRRDREGVVEQAVDAAVLLEGGVDEVLAGLLVVDVGGYDERPPAVRPDHLGHLVEPLLGPRDQHEVGAELGRLLAERAPEPGPDARTARRPCPAAAAVIASSRDHPSGDADLAVGDAGGVVARRRSGCPRSGGGARPASRTAPPRPSGPSAASSDARESLPAQHHHALRVAAGLQPVGDAGVALADDVAAASRRGRRATAPWSARSGGARSRWRCTTASRSGSPGSRSRQTGTVTIIASSSAERVVPDRGELRGEPARRRLRRR